MPSTIGIVASGYHFDPLSLSPALWLDAADTSTITSSSGAVSQWNDKSGNGRNVTQATAAAQPGTGAITQNGLNVLTFDGGDFLTHDAGSDVVNIAPLSFAIVAYDNNSTQTAATYRRVFSSRRSATGAFDFQSPNSAINKSNLTREMAAGGNGIFSPLVTYTNQSPFVLVGKMTSSGASIALNSTSLNTTSGNAAIGLQRYLRVGAGCTNTGTPPAANASEIWNGRIMEVILFPSDLSTTNLTAVVTYLNSKWAVY